ncbi:MAG TPA: glycosyltransferase family 39 protein [bacterium]|nr:glycosyltransferase family 39 protein [bacterium]
MRQTVKAVLAAAAVAAAGTAFVLLYARYSPGESSVFVVVLGKLWHLGLFLFFWLAVYAVGRGVQKLVLGRSAGPPEIAVAFGVVAFVALAFLMCAVRLAYVWVARGFIISAAVAGVAILRGEFGRAPGRFRKWLGDLGLSTAALVAGVAVLAAPVALTAAHPPTYVDALVYHLAVPKAYAAAHGFTYLAYNAYASMPLGGSLFYLWPYLWDGLIAANACHLVATLLAVSLTYRLARRWLSQFYAALAGAFVILTPVVFISMGGAQNDHFLVLFVVAALYEYFKIEETGPRARARRCVSAGLFVGAALAVKYSAVAALAALAVIFFYDISRKRVRLRDGVIIFAVAVAVFIPWLAKAYVEQGNPVFPVCYDFFGGRGFTPEQAGRVASWLTGMGRGRGFLDYVLLPYRISVQAGAMYEDFAGKYLPFLLPLAALGAVFFRRGGRVVAFGWIYLAAWAFGPQQLRFLDGALPALAIAAAGALGVADGAYTTWVRRASRAVVAAAVIFVAAVTVGPADFAMLPRHLYLGGMPQREFLRRWVAFYRAQEFMNEQLPSDAKVLLLYYNQTLYLERPTAYDSFLNASALLLAAEKTRDEAELYDLVRSWGVTHIHVYQYGEPRLEGFYSAEAVERVHAFASRFGVVLYEDPYGKVYELI